MDAGAYGLWSRASIRPTSGSTPRHPNQYRLGALVLFADDHELSKVQVCGTPLKQRSSNPHRDEWMGRCRGIQRDMATDSDAVYKGLQCGSCSGRLHPVVLAGPTLECENCGREEMWDDYEKRMPPLPPQAA